MTEDETTGEENVGRGEVHSAAHTLAAAALMEALSPSQRRRLAGTGALCMVIRAPSAGWVEPLANAARTRGGFDLVETASAVKRGRSLSDPGVEAARILARGGRVLGVSQSPECFLPSVLVTAADIRASVKPASNRVLASVIEAATGARPCRLPPRAAAGLDFADVVAAVRLNDRPSACVRRLRAAVAAQSRGDEELADAPLLEELHGYGEAAII